MNGDMVEGKWKQVKGNIQKKWGKLTDDDLDEIKGRREHFIGKVQEKYGTSKEDAEKEWDNLSQ